MMTKRALKIVAGAITTFALAASPLSFPQREAMAQSGCRDMSAPASVLAGRDVDIYNTERRFVRTAPATEFGATLRYIDCGDVRYVGVERGSDMMLIRRSVIAPPPTPVDNCYCPGPGGNVRSKTFGAPGIASPPQCPASRCATR